MLETIKSNLKGIFLSVFIGAFALVLGFYTPSSLNSILLALIFGILIGNVFKIPQNLDSGISFTSSKLLEISIVFLAFGINYSNFAKIGSTNFLIIAFTICAVLSLSYFLSKKFNCPGSTGILVGFGTAICGSSAIAALSPSLKKEKEDVAIAMAVVNLFGTIGMILFPIILAKIPMLNPQDIGALIGGTLHSVGNVAGAGFAMGKEIGDVSITIKLVRVALLTPGLIFMNFLINRKNAVSWKDHFKLPWYLLAFIVITFIATFVQFPKSLIDTSEIIGKGILTIAMAAIGLKVSFKKLIQSGKRGLTFGLVIFMIQILIITILI
jgi:uncharacterized integral membrane protein (TIGR00698 family)